MSEVCRIKLTSEEEEKLLLVDRLVQVRHVVAKPPSLPPGPSFLVQSPLVIGDLSKGHPRLKLSLSNNCIVLGKCFINYQYLRRVEAQFPVALIH